MPTAGTKKSGWDATENDGEESAVSAPVPPRRRRGLKDSDEDGSSGKHNDPSSPSKHDIPEIDGEDEAIANLIPDLEVGEEEDMARQARHARSMHLGHAPMRTA